MIFMPAHIVPSRKIVPNRKIDASFKHILSLTPHVPVTLSLCMLNVSIAVKGWLTVCLDVICKMLFVLGVYQ